MASRIYRLKTTASTNLNRISDYNAIVDGWTITNTAAYAIFVKLYWYYPRMDGTNDTPTVGTTVPNLTINVPTVATATFSHPKGIQGGGSTGGQLWIAATKLAADSDTTVLVLGDGLITLFVDY